eukprot:COSAG01_NODE_9_length_43729_cov_66.133463_9_plen_366_part_00
MNKTVLEKYAHLLSQYCLNVKAGERILIKSTHLATPLLQALQTEITRAGAQATYQLQFEDENRLFLEASSEAQRASAPPFYAYAVENFDAILTIKAPYSLKNLSQIPESKKMQQQEALGKIKETLLSRSEKGGLRWCLCVYPNPSMAAACQLSLEDYEKFISQACFLDKDDPAKAWTALSSYQKTLIERLQKKSDFHIKGPQTDLKFSCHNRYWINSDGRRNMPSGEVFSCPIEDQTEGQIHFNYPSIYQGREVADVTLVFEKGKVVSHRAKIGQSLLDAVLKVPGANCLGEVAFGTNTHIQRATKDILFDEKIGGSMHLAIGSSYPETGGKNKSAIHWDMIKDMSQGQVYADDALIYEHGIFKI